MFSVLNNSLPRVTCWWRYIKTTMSLRTHYATMYMYAKGQHSERRTHMQKAM